MIIRHFAVSSNVELFATGFVSKGAERSLASLLQ